MKQWNAGPFWTLEIVHYWQALAGRFVASGKRQKWRSSWPELGEWLKRPMNRLFIEFSYSLIWARAISNFLSEGVKGEPLCILAKNNFRDYRLILLLINTGLLFHSRKDPRVTPKGFFFRIFLIFWKNLVSKIDSVIEMQKQFSRSWKTVEPALWCQNQLRSSWTTK